MRRMGILSLLFLGLCGAAVAGAPTIIVDYPVYTASVQSGSIVSHTFELTNTGDETLSITTVQTSCGCTTTALAKPNLAPGESVDLEAKVNTAGFVGTVERTLTVQSNDPATPNLVLRMALTVANEAETTPSQDRASSPSPATVGSQTPAVVLPAVWPLVLVGILAAGLALLLVLVLRR